MNHLTAVLPYILTLEQNHDGVLAPMTLVLSNEAGAVTLAWGRVLSVFQIPFQLFVYPTLVHKFGPLKVLRIGLVLAMVLSFMPLVRFFSHGGAPLEMATMAVQMIRR